MVEERADAGFEALHSLYWLVVNLADQAPLLMLVDDCHWVDRDSLRFLAFLLPQRNPPKAAAVDENAGADRELQKRLGHG